MTLALTALREWNRTLLVDDGGHVIHSTFPADIELVGSIVHAWNDRDATVGNGFVIDGTEYEVHRCGIYLGV